MNATRELFTIPLEPVLGDRFQPTGFPNLGAAEFERPVGESGWERCLLVESAQSMANRLEAVLWDAPARQPIDLIAGLPHVRVVGNDGQFLTSSRLEAHRIASAYIRNGSIDGEKATAVINGRLGIDDDRQRAPFEVAPGIFGLDPMCLIHGVFLSDKAFPGQPKVLRALTGAIEAHDVKEAHSGGVKKDSVYTGQEGSGGGSTEGYGMVPFDRTEWVAREIVAQIALDLGQITSYGLPDAATELLADLARLQVRLLLDGGLRLRTACDLQPSDDIVDHTGTPLPTYEDLERRVRAGVEAVGNLTEGGSVDVTWVPKGKKPR